MFARPLVLAALVPDVADAQRARAQRSARAIGSQTMPAHGAVTGYTRGAVRTLPVSGTQGQHMETVMAPVDGWVYGVEIGEKADQPCYLGIWAVEGSTPAPGFPVAFDRCAGDVNDGRVAALGFAYARNRQAWRAARQLVVPQAIPIPVYSEIRTVSILLRGALDNSDPTPPIPVVDGEPAPLDGIGVCQRNSNDEVKGLRIHGSTLDFSGAHVGTDPIVTTSPQSAGGLTVPAGARVNEEFRRPNCSSNNGGWQTIRTCATGEVLVGLDVHYKFPPIGNQQRARITGLAPKCARVTIERG